MRILLILLVATSLITISGCQSRATKHQSTTMKPVSDVTIIPRGAHEDQYDFRARLKAQQKSEAVILPKGEHEDQYQFRARLKAQEHSIATIEPKGTYEDQYDFRERLNAHSKLK